MSPSCHSVLDIGRPLTGAVHYYYPLTNSMQLYKSNALRCYAMQLNCIVLPSDAQNYNE